MRLLAQSEKHLTKLKEIHITVRKSLMKQKTMKQ